MSLHTLAAALSFVLIVGASSTNAYKIVKRQVSPTLSTWLIILAASLMSFLTYWNAGHRDLVAGALNGADVFSTAISSIAIVFFSPLKLSLKPFEKYYLGGLVLIAIFWAFTSDAFLSNLLIQVLISIGYFPTAHNLIRNRKNSESFTVWGLILTASVVSLYPTINAYLTEGNVLALVYSLRSVVMLGAMLILMAYYHRKTI